MERSTFGHVTDWNEVIKKEARGQNDADLGEGGCLRFAA
jgi:hypothetical protein